MFAPDPRRLIVETHADSHLALADGEETLAQIIAALRPASTLFLVHSPRSLPAGVCPDVFGDMVRSALMSCCPDPAEATIIRSGDQSLAAIFTPLGESVLDAVASHALVLGLRDFLSEQTHSASPGWSDELVILPIATVPSIVALQENLAALNEFLDAILKKKFNVHFQPIVHFASGKVFGYEALIRVPQSGIMKKPGMFFRAADKARLVSWMDVHCQERCFEEAARSGVRDFLFTNMDAEGLSHVQQSGYDIVGRARSHGIAPSRVVLEITERQAVQDFPRLAPFIEELRDAGFKIAVDDAGAGYSSLHTIAELRPDFIKIDRSLVRTLQDNGPRRSLLSTLSRFAAQVGASVIAEGCETKDELTAVIECGVTYGQGYVMARPNEGFKGVRREIREFIADRMSHRLQRVLGASYPIERMARRGVTLPPDAPSSDAAHRFRKFPDMDSIVIVTADGRVEGLLSRSRWEGCGGKDQPETPIERWMDRRPMLVDTDMPLESVAARTTYRDGAQFQDDLVVVQGGEYAGIVPVRALMEALVTHKANMPRYEHPVTGCPSMAGIELAVNEELALGRPIAIISAEIAYFRPFNHHYGMTAGDDLLRATASLMKEAVRGQGSVAHLHGNDFMVALSPERLEETCRLVTEKFPEIAHAFYSAEDRKQNLMLTVDPAGQARKVPLAAIRLFGLSSVTRDFRTFSQGYRLVSAMRQSARRAGLPQGGSSYKLE